MKDPAERREMLSGHNYHWQTGYFECLEDPGLGRVMYYVNPAYTTYVPEALKPRHMMFHDSPFRIKCRDGNSRRTLASGRRNMNDKYMVISDTLVWGGEQDAVGIEENYSTGILRQWQ